jgi:hypothetical protein
MSPVELFCNRAITAVIEGSLEESRIKEYDVFNCGDIDCKPGIL